MKRRVHEAMQRRQKTKFKRRILQLARSVLGLASIFKFKKKVHSKTERLI
jgi:hypothetical protein